MKLNQVWMDGKQCPLKIHNAYYTIKSALDLNGYLFEIFFTEYFLLKTEAQDFRAQGSRLAPQNPSEHWKVLIFRL